jgi:hypothetical protein
MSRSAMWCGERLVCLRECQRNIYSSRVFSDHEI